jgi:hypothetical protein
MHVIGDLPEIAHIKPLSADRKERGYPQLYPDGSSANRLFHYHRCQKLFPQILVAI